MLVDNGLNPADLPITTALRYYVAVESGDDEPPNWWEE